MIYKRINQNFNLKSKPDYSMGRLPRSNPGPLEVVPVSCLRSETEFVPICCGDNEVVTVPVLVPVFVLKLESNVFELDTPELPAVEDTEPGRRDLLYLEPGTPGLVGSSRLLGFLDRITTTRCIVGRKAGSPCVHSKPI